MAGERLKGALTRMPQGKAPLQRVSPGVYRNQQGGLVQRTPQQMQRANIPMPKDRGPFPPRPPMQPQEPVATLPMIGAPGQPGRQPMPNPMGGNLGAQLGQQMMNTQVQPFMGQAQIPQQSYLPPQPMQTSPKFQLGFHPSIQGGLPPQMTVDGFPATQTAPQMLTPQQMNQLNPYNRGGM